MTGIAASSKSGGAAQFESTLERDFISLLEFLPEVKSIDPQPVKIGWLDENGCRRSYTPDVLVEFIESAGKPPWLCEVKYRNELLERWAQLRPKFKAAFRFAKTQGWRFKIVTEREVRTPHLVNARFLTGYRRTTPNAGVVQDILEHLNKMNEATPRDLLASLRSDAMGQAQLIGVLWHLVATFRIGADLEKPLTMKSRIWSLS